MEIISVQSGPVDTIGYLVYDRDLGKGVVIDTPLDSSNEFLQIIHQTQTQIEAILLTHTHWDHTADAASLSRATGVPVWVHRDDSYRLVEPMKHTVFHLPFEIEGVQNPKYLNHYDVIGTGDLRFEIRHTPGHTEGSVCFVEHVHKTVFTGDTLFFESIGRTDLPGGNYENLLNSIKNEIMTLDDDYKIFSGHGESSTIAHERIFNPFINGSLI